MFDLVHIAMRRAVKAFGDRKDNLFNAACFGTEFCKLAGVVGGLDGHVVEAILCGRGDVEQLSGGAHYRLIEKKGR